MALLYIGLGLGFIGGWVLCALFISHESRRLQVLVEQLRSIIETYQAPPGPGLRPAPSED